MPRAVQVVIIDEAQRTLDNLQRLLRFESDIDVVGMALSARGGIEEAKRLQPDIVLMDVNMPDLDAIKATRILSAALPQVRVVLMSVQVDRDYLRRAIEAGAHEYLVKPLSADDLVAAVRRLGRPGGGSPGDAQDTQQTATQARPVTVATPMASVAVAIPAGDAAHMPGLPDPSGPAQQASPAAPTPVPPRAAPAVPRPAPGPGPASQVTPSQVAPSQVAPSQVAMNWMQQSQVAPSRVAPPGVLAPAPGDRRPSQMMPAVRPPVGAAQAAAVAVPGPEGPAEPPDLTMVERRQRAGQLTLVWSGKGGVGKTIMAINVASVLAEEGVGDVALVDLDLQFGDVAVLLGLENSKTISDIVDAWPNIDAPFVGSLMPEAAGGVRVLAAPVSPELADLITPAHVRTTLDLLRNAFDHVIVDASSHLGDVILEAVEMADRIILVTDLDIHSIKEAKLSLKLLERLSIPNERIHLVCNRFDTGGAISVAQLEASLRFPTAVKIPANDKLMKQSISRAVPIVQLFPDAEVSQRIKELVGSLVPLAGAEGRRGGKGGKLRFWPRSTAS